MAASRSSSSRTRQARRARPSAAPKTQSATALRSGRTAQNRSGRTVVADGLSNLAEQLVNRVIKPLGLVVLSRERIQETLDEAAERGRLTRSDANELGTQLIQRGRQQTEELLADVERLLGRGRQQLDTAARRSYLGEPIDRLVRGAGLARRKVAGSGSFPISDYDEMSVAQVQERLGSLSAAELRKVRDHERRHANRKSLLATIDKLLD